MTGQFTDQAQTVTYVYTKDKGTLTAGDTEPSSQDKNHKSEASSSHQNVLPETGENEKKILMTVGTGLALLIFSLIVFVFGSKRFKNDK